MKPTKLSALIIAGVLAAATSGNAVADPATPAAESAPVKAWVKTKDMDCNWWLSREDGHSLRASIEANYDGVALTFGDPIFNTWPESGYPKVELRFDRDPKRRVQTKGWA